MKVVVKVVEDLNPNWIGDGFPSRALWYYGEHGSALSPFLVVGYIGPFEFSPVKDGGRRRGVGAHPHRGFETVSIVYKGGVEHRDSTGQSGIIEEGEVQWMTAAGGVLHDEFHSEAFARSGGTFQMIQLWVNLPAKDKQTPPSYQAIVSGDIPVVAFPENAGEVRLIAGSYAERTGPARTFTPMNVLDIRLRAGARVVLPARAGWNTAVAVLEGNVRVNGKPAKEAQLVLLDAQGEGVKIETTGEAILLMLSGEPIDEPVIGQGPFVMNNQQEIIEAVADFSRGKFGNI